MGALPKNKITSAERGKRRAGNTPTISKDHRITAIPQHKQGIVDSIFTAVGLSSAQKHQPAKAEGKTAATKTSHQATADSPMAQSTAAASAVKARQPVNRTTRKTQHKG